jgi:hypothetical protein
MVFSYSFGHSKIIDDKTYMSNAGCFDGHDNALVQYHEGFTQSHWMPPSGKYSHTVFP